MNNLLLFAIIVICASLIFFLFLIFKSKKKHEAIKHYEEIRDKLSVREAEKETGITEEDYQNYSGGFLAKIVGGFMVVLIGMALMPEVSKQVNTAVNNSSSSNITGASSPLLNFIPFIFILAVVCIGIMVIYGNCIKNAEDKIW